MVAVAESVEWIDVRNEVEAFFLEFNLIKRHRPRFNIRLKDDKSYPFLAVTLDEEWPRAMVMRGAKQGVSATTGRSRTPTPSGDARPAAADVPDPHVHPGEFDRHHRLGRPCLCAHIEKVAAPCVGAVQREEYDQLVADLLEFLDGDHSPVLDRLDKQMHGAADSLEYERRSLRDQIASVRKVIERQQMVGPKEEDFDCIGLADDAPRRRYRCSSCKGRVVGRKGLVVDKVEDLEPALVGRILEQLYGDVPATDVPARSSSRASRRRRAV